MTDPLDVARQLARMGVPLFLAPPAMANGSWDAAGGTGKCGYWLPAGWENSPADPSVVDRWRPGMALAMVCGRGLDVIDIDPRNGGDINALNGATPRMYALAATPSGGVHALIASLGVRKGVLAPGIDIQAGDGTGNGRGFVFIAPTRKVSKVTGQIGGYVWADVYLDEYAAGDDSGKALAELLHKPVPTGVDDFMRVGPWADVEKTLGEGRNNGVAKLAASLRGRGGLLLEDAIDVMYRRVWPVVERVGGDHEFTTDEFETVIRNAWRQYRDGAEEREETADTPPDPGNPQPNPGRYFDKHGLRALTIAEDVLSLGPLRYGVDDRMWRYSLGVWVPDKNVARERAATLLGNRYRRSHNGTIEDMVRVHTGEITPDPVPMVVNFANGLYDWKRGTLRDHSPEVPTTVQIPHDYDPEATCPEFERFLGEVLPADMVPVVWELLAYLLYSGNPFHRAVMLTGTGRNGKGTFLRVVGALLGRRNVTSASLHDLINTRFTTASLVGKLANVAGDIDGRYVENTATFKAITGEDQISAEHKGKDRFDFTPFAVPMFSANKVPASADTTVGYLSRWLVIPFPHDFTGREDRSLSYRLLAPAELRGIAAKAVRLLPELFERGDFTETASGRQAKEEFNRRVDQVRTWLDDCTHVEPEHWRARGEMYAAYRRWTAANGHQAVRAGEFYDRLESAGLRPTIRNGTRGFTGARIHDANDDNFGVPPHNQGAATGAVTGEYARVKQPQKSYPPADLHPENAPAPYSTSRFVAEGAEGADNSPPENLRPTTEGSSRNADYRGKGDLHPLHPARGESDTPQLPLVVNPVSGITGTTPGAAASLLAPMTALTVDVETSGYPIGHQAYALKTVQLGDADHAVVFDPADPAQAGVITRALAAAHVLHAHSAPADLAPLIHAGLCDASVWERMHDTALLAKLGDPPPEAVGLKDLAGLVLGTDAASPAADRERAAYFKANKWQTTIKTETSPDRSGWAQADPTHPTMAIYAASDVLDAAGLARALPAVPPAILDRERAVQRITGRVSSAGVALDGDRVRRLLAEHTAARDAAAVRARELGIDNIGSSQQVGKALSALGVELPTTRKGALSVADSALSPLRELDGTAGDVVRARLDFQHHKTVVGLFLEPYRQLCEHGDGRARPTIHTLGTETGRMACVRPNLQQLPRTGGVRACLVADPGYALISADFAGVEIRVMAALSGDPALIRMIRKGVDLHAVIAEQVYGARWTKANRYTVKRGVFGWAYGGGVPALAKQLGVSEGVMTNVVDTLAGIAPTYVRWASDVKAGVRHGATRFPTYSGRTIHLPESTPHKAPNYCIQGTARELLCDALLKWEQSRFGGAVLFPVHDEIVAMVPEADAEHATAQLAECMTAELYGVPIAAEASAPALAWGDAA